MRYQSTYRFDVIQDALYESEMLKAEQELEKYANYDTVTSFDDAKLFCVYYLAENPRASVVFVHGFKEFTKKYCELALYFLQMGYNVFLYDQRGHGLSHRETEDKTVIHINRFEDYVEDLHCVIQTVVLPQSQKIPVYLYAHSMGGAVALLYLSAHNETVKKALLSAPMVYPVCMSLPQKVLRFLVKKNAGKDGWTAKSTEKAFFDPDQKYIYSSDLSECRFKRILNYRIAEPKYQYSTASHRWNYEALGVIEKLFDKKNLRQIHAEIFMVSAGQDTVVENKPQQKLAKQLKCKFKCLEHAKHSLYTQKDTDLQAYLEEVFTFFDSDRKESVTS